MESDYTKIKTLQFNSGYIRIDLVTMEQMDAIPTKKKFVELREKEKIYYAIIEDIVFIYEVQILIPYHI